MENIYNLKSVFENCSLLTFIPDISKWKFNNKIEINNMFKGCKSLLITPDISKWSINIPSECISFPSFNSNSNSIIDNIIYSSNFSEDLPSMKDDDYTNSFENIKSIDFYNNNDVLDDYYDNFYN